MAEQSVISTDQMKEILDNAPVAVFVCSIKDRSLLYRNSLAKELFPGANRSDATCYHVAGFEEPCPFCHMGEMRRDGFVTREYSHPNSGRIYQLSGRLIDWAGEAAHIEYILDITEKKREEEQQRKSEEALLEAHERMRETQQELNHLVNSIPGGIAIYKIEEGRYILTYMSDGVPTLTGYTREEYEERARQGIFDNIYEPDRARIVRTGQAFIESGEVLDVSYRVRHKDGSLVWIHLNGRCISPTRFYAAFTGMSAESRLFQSIANETADGIYVIDRESYELLYANESKSLFVGGKHCIGQKCYAVLQGKDAPCEFCALNGYGADGEEHEIKVDDSGRVYSSRFRETDWNGIPAYVQYIRDVTGEVQTRREKERLELYFQSILEALPSGVCVMATRPDGSMFPEYISEGFAAMTRMTLEESYALYRKNVFGGVHPDDIEPSQAKVQALLESGAKHFEIEARFLRGDGSYIWVKDQVSIQTGADGVQRLYSVYTDISETVAENERIKRQHEDLILEHYRTPGADELILGHCNITQNRIIQMKDFTGSDLLHTLGKNREGFFTGLAGFIADEQEKQAFLGTYLRAPALAAFKRGETELAQTCFVKLPGQPAGCYIQIKMNMIAAPDTGDVTGVLTVTDVTDSMMFQRVLDQLSVTTHDYIVDVNLPADSFKVLSYNEQADEPPKPQGCHSQRVSYIADAVILKKDRERYVEALRPDTIRRRLEEENAYTITYSLINKSGDIRTKNMTVFAIDRRLERICLVCTDITDSVRALEDALALAKEASQAKSDFLTTMSHDIRTPMNAIMGMTTLALSYLDKDRDRAQDCLRKIQTANKHLLSLINDVLDMNRIERSKIAMNLRALSLPELIGEITAIIEPQAKDAGLRFVMEKKDIHTEWFSGDSLRLSQILINLLSNAVKFTAEGGSVAFLAEEIAPVEQDQNVRFRFTVRDTGVGMSEEFLNHVFDPFARENTAPGVEGTGLGLSIVKGLVDRMGGSISVESHTGHGTAFRVELEFEAAEPPEQTDISNETQSGAPRMEKPFAGRTFLIVEDYPINAELLCELLKMDGADAVVATDGAKAVRAFENAASGTYDAILMDIQMPVMNGYEAARAIRALGRPDAETIPIVAMTANAFAEDVQAARDAGMDAHVAKPIDVEVLRSTLGSLLRR